ncbi:MAG: hypothetical protein H7330_05960 [Hymenobacteraceae bacterium]|nr:hypothetical protein [Hymenobacteraceae bacterium]
MVAPAYWLTFEDRPGYLLACVWGYRDSLETSIAFWQEIGLEVHSRRPTRLLVQESFLNDVSMPAMTEVVLFVAEMGFRDLKLAFVDEQVEQLPSNRIAEALAVSYGLSVKVFVELGEAEKWLLAD